MNTGYLIHFVLPFGLAMVITFVLIPLWIKICSRWKLFDEPDSRKHHMKITPSMGGIAIFAGVFIAFLVFAEIFDHNKFRFLLGAVIILFFTGFFDDLMDISPTNKLILQTVSAMIIFYSGFRITSFGGLCWIYDIPYFLQMPLTLFFIVLFTNAYNFIDGVDGLAGSLGVIASSCFGALFFHYGKLDYAVLSFCLTGALLGFLFFNFSPAKIFMGDTGSLMTGFIISALAVELSNCGIEMPQKAINPIILVAILFIPLYDILRVFILRMFNRKSPFLADRNHVHHLMLGFGFGHRSVTLYIASINMLFIILSSLHNFLPFNALLFVLPLLMYLIIHPKVLGPIASLHHRLFKNHLEDNSPTR